MFAVWSQIHSPCFTCRHISTGALLTASGWVWPMEALVGVEKGEGGVRVLFSSLSLSLSFV